MKASWKRLLSEQTMPLALLAIWLFFGLEQPLFLSSRNLSLLLIELSVTASLALGMLLVLLPGQIDLSAGSGLGLAGALAAVLVFWHGVPAPLALLVAGVVCVAVWAAMGALIVRQRIPAFIITLGGLLVFKGLHWLTIHNQTVPIAEGGKSNAYSLLTTYYVSPAVGYVLAALVVAGFVLSTLRARARRVAHGFPVADGERVFLGLFVTAQLVFLLPVVTNQYRGVPLPALILGALSLAVHVLTAHTPFGRYLYAIGSNEEAALISGVLFGALIMASLLNGMTLMAVAPEVKLIARGVVLALAVWVDVKLNSE